MRAVALRLGHAEHQIFGPATGMKYEAGVELVRLGRGFGALQPVVVTGVWHKKQGLRSCGAVNDDHRGQPFSMAGDGQAHPFTLWRIHDFQHSVGQITGNNERVGGVMVPVVAVTVIP